MELPGAKRSRALERISWVINVELNQRSSDSELGARGQQIRDRASAWLTGDISLSEFHSWFASETWDAHIWNDPDAKRLASKIDLLLSEYTGGYLPVHDLKEAVTGVIGSFVSPIVPAT